MCAGHGVARGEAVVDRDADPALGGQVLHQREALVLLGADRPGAAVHLEQDRGVLDRVLAGREVDVEVPALAGLGVGDVADHAHALVGEVEGAGEAPPRRGQVGRVGHRVELLDVVDAEALDERVLEAVRRRGGSGAPPCEAERAGTGQREAGLRPRSPRGARRSGGWRRRAAVTASTCGAASLKRNPARNEPRPERRPRLGRRALAVRAATTPWRSRKLTCSIYWPVLLSCPMTGMAAPISRSGRAGDDQRARETASPRWTTGAAPGVAIRRSAGGPTAATPRRTCRSSGWGPCGS